MEEQKDDDNPDSTTLEHSDNEESIRQLWWTIGVTVTGLAVVAYFYL